MKSRNELNRKSNAKLKKLDFKKSNFKTRKRKKKSDFDS